MVYTVPDCLVLKIQEIESHTNKIDTVIYIIYNNLYNNFIIRGKRTDLNESCSFGSYSFECKYIDDVINFLDYTICSYNNVNEILYNYKNLPRNANDITFDFLDNNNDKSNEISGYNNIDLCENNLNKTLGIIKNTQNYFN
jgi:hypothetical protein